MSAYLDTSALVKLWNEEVGSALVRSVVSEEEPLGTSVVAYAEARAAFARALREQRWAQGEHDAVVSDLERRWTRLMRVVVTNTLAFEAGRLAERHRLRGFDAIHLASALRLRERLDEPTLGFVCFDERLVEAARAEGFRIPG